MCHGREGNLKLLLNIIIMFIIHILKTEIIEVVHCCVNQPCWSKKNPSLLSYKKIFFKTLKKNALVKEFSLLLQGKSFRE